MKKIFGIISFICFFSGLGITQETKEILDKARAALKNVSYHVDVNYNYEFLTESGEIENTLVESYFRQYKDGYVQFLAGSFFQLQKDSIMLSIDFEEKEISLDHTPIIADFGGFNEFDKLDNDYYNISSENLEGKYKVNFIPKGEYAPFKSMVIFYSESDFFVEKIITEYEDIEIGGIAKLTIDYENKKSLTARSLEDTLEHYVTMTAGGFEVVNKNMESFYKINNLWVK